MARITELLANNPTVKQLQRRYDGMPQRDRQALVGLSVFAALVLLYLGVWAPVQGGLEKAQSELEIQQELYAYLKSNEAEARKVSRRGGAQAVTKISGDQLLATVTDSAKRQQLAVKRFEPKGDDGLRIWLEDVPYASTVKWLYELDERFGVKISQIAMDRAKVPGTVNVKLTFRI